jgi:hypothetical protein
MKRQRAAASPRPPIERAAACGPATVAHQPPPDTALSRDPEQQPSSGTCPPPPELGAGRHRTEKAGTAAEGGGGDSRGNGGGENRAAVDLSKLAGDIASGPHPFPRNEAERLHKLAQLRVVGRPLPQCDPLVREATRLFRAPISVVSLVDAHRQWFVSEHGLGANQTDRESAFCAHAIMEDAPMPFVVADSKEDPRFCDNVLGELTRQPPPPLAAWLPALA